MLLALLMTASPLEVVSLENELMMDETRCFALARKLRHNGKFI